MRPDESTSPPPLHLSGRTGCAHRARAFSTNRGRPIPLPSIRPIPHCGRMICARTNRRRPRPPLQRRSVRLNPRPSSSARRDSSSLRDKSCPYEKLRGETILIHFSNRRFEKYHNFFILSFFRSFIHRLPAPSAISAPFMQLIRKFTPHIREFVFFLLPHPAALDFWTK